MTETLLGEGTSFEDVEKLRKRIVAKEMMVFDIEEMIRTKTDAMETGREHDMNELREKQEELRTLKKQCEQELKDYKKELNDDLKQKRHEMTINDELREDDGFTKTNWPGEVKSRTREEELIIPQKVEDLRKEQAENIGLMEMSVTDLSDSIHEKYGKIEDEIKAHKRRIRLNKIELANLRLKHNNRVVFARAVLNGFGTDEQISVPAK